jgi:hypothetical protein
VVCREADGQLVANRGPQLAAQHVFNIGITIFDQIGLGIDDAIPLPLGTSW